MSSSLPLQQYPTCLVHLTWMVLEMGSNWLYSCCSVGCYFQDLFSTAHSILVEFLSSFFSLCFFSVHVVHLYSNIDTTTAWKKSSFILSDRSDFYTIDNLLIAINAFARCILTSLSVDGILWPRYVNISTNFRGSPFRVEMAPFQLKHMYSFCLCSHGGQCLLLPAPGYVAWILLG